MPQHRDFAVYEPGNRGKRSDVFLRRGPTTSLSPQSRSLTLLSFSLHHSFSHLPCLAPPPPPIFAAPHALFQLGRGYVRGALLPVQKCSGEGGRPSSLLESGNPCMLTLQNVTLSLNPVGQPQPLPFQVFPFHFHLLPFPFQLPLSGLVPTAPLPVPAAHSGLHVSENRLTFTSGLPHWSPTGQGGEKRRSHLHQMQREVTTVHH